MNASAASPHFSFSFFLSPGLLVFIGPGEWCLRVNGGWVGICVVIMVGGGGGGGGGCLRKGCAGRLVWTGRRRLVEGALAVVSEFLFGWNSFRLLAYVE